MVKVGTLEWAESEIAEIEKIYSASAKEAHRKGVEIKDLIRKEDLFELEDRLDEAIAALIINDPKSDKKKPYELYCKIRNARIAS